MMTEAYKLMRIRKDGTLGSLFINRSQVIPMGAWLEAEHHPTKGFANRMGWHCTPEPIAPHLKLEPVSGEHRAWVKVQVRDFTYLDRPASQGGKWILANRIKCLYAL